MSEFSNYLEAKLDELVTANRILGRENVCDAFGHVSIRHPARDDRYFLSRSRAPERIEVDDLMEFTLDGDPIDQKGRSPYAERFIHGAIYAKRPDVHSVVHNHSMNVIPFGVTKTPSNPYFICVHPWDVMYLYGTHATNLGIPICWSARWIWVMTWLILSGIKGPR